MLKKLLAAAVVLSFISATGAVDINQATEADLDSLKGVGPATSRLILAERQKAPFADWDDLIQRVRGMGGKNAVKYSAQGLTVEGAAYSAGETQPRKRTLSKSDGDKAP